MKPARMPPLYGYAYFLLRVFFFNISMIEELLPSLMALFLKGVLKVNLILQVDSANKHGILLEVVQILTDLNLIITKAYISSDGGWFMDGNNFL